VTKELFDRAPQEVIDFFESKGQRPSFHWRDVAPEEHAYAFTVAKSAGYDILDDIRAATAEAIEKGEAFETFRSRLEPVLKEKGWWGRGLAYDDIRDRWTTGQLGSVRRLRTIYWGNTATSKAAGEWQRIQRTKKFLPFLLYVRSTAERKRPLHQSWADQPVILPVDHEWWSTHYPPNGWLCKCSVRQITRAAAMEAGWSEGVEAPTINMVPWRDRRNGRTVWVAEGIDPGWDHHVGLNRSRNVANFLGDKLDELPKEARRAAITDVVTSPMFRELMESRAARQTVIPVAPVTERMRDARPTTAEHVFLSADSARHILDEHASRGLTPGDFAKALEVISNGEIIKRDDPRALVFIGAFGERLYRAVVKILPDEAWLVSFHSKGRKK
jgi:hypothetical protein